MRRVLVLTVILIAIPAVAHAGGGGVDRSACPGFGEGTTVVMEDSCFAGTAHFVPSGDPVTVENLGQLPHTLTAVDGSFDTGSVAAGSSAELAIDEPGVYRVFCTLHGTAGGEGMAGVLVVGDLAEASLEDDGAANSSSAMGVAVGDDPADPSVIATSERGVEPTQLVVLLVVGLTLGLALAALLTALRMRVGETA